MKINRLVSQIIQFKGHYHDGTSMVVIFKIDEKETSPKGCQVKINRLVLQIIQFKGHYHDGTSMVVIFKIDEKETSPKGWFKLMR